MLVLGVDNPPGLVVDLVVRPVGVELGQGGGHAVVLVLQREDFWWVVVRMNEGVRDTKGIVSFRTNG